MESSFAEMRPERLTSTFSKTERNSASSFCLDDDTCLPPELVSGNDSLERFTMAGGFFCKWPAFDRGAEDE
jgi:hypothetical protein